MLGAQVAGRLRFWLLHQRELHSKDGRSPQTQRPSSATVAEPEPTKERMEEGILIKSYLDPCSHVYKPEETDT